MVHPEFHKGSAQPREFDVLILGAGLAGVASAAILANRGYRVALLDSLPQPGGRVGATHYRNSWISLGHRDAECGIGDLGQPHAVRERAEAEAGIVIPRRKGAYGNNNVLVHDPLLRTTRQVSMADITTSSGGDGIARYRELITALVPGATDIDEAAEEIAEIFDRLSRLSEEEAWAMVPVTMGPWVTRNVRHPIARRFLINLMEAGHATPGEDASVGRWILCMPWKYSSPDWCIAEGAGAMQTIIQPWVDAIEGKGGELWLGWKPVEIVVERPRQSGQGSGHRGKVTGVVGVNTSNLVQQFNAPIVISTHFGWDLPRLIEPDLLPSDFLAQAEATRTQCAEIAGWIGQFHRLPVLRENGLQETFTGWQRVLAGSGLVRNYGGGFNWTSLTDPACCPPGMHQLHVIVGHHGESRSFDDIKGMVDPLLDFLRDHYVDLDDCLEWGRYQWGQAPQLLAWHLKPTYRHPVKVSTVTGLYCASSSAEGMAGWVDLECQVALQAAMHIELDFGGEQTAPGFSAWPASNLDWAARRPG